MPKKTKEFKVCVLGMGYIGLPTAAVLASRGHHVHGVEINEAAREVINSGKAHVVEPDLDMLVQAGVDSGRLKAYAEPAKADVFMLCVPTPVGEENGADLSFVRQAAESICPFLELGNLVILESTSPPGTTELIAEIITEKTHFKAGDIYFAHAPERVLPGQILHEVVHNDRIIGGINEGSTQKACDFFRTYVVGQLITCHCRMAEMAKLVENASRDSQIAFANELSVLCDDLNLEVRELIEIANHHPRVNILQPGCGVGGHCIAVDPWFLVHMSKGKAKLIRTAREVNQAKPKWVVEQVVTKANRFRDPVIACFGAAYKPDIDDLRESPAMEIIKDLQDKGIGKVLVVEPNVEELSRYNLVTVDDALAEADIVVFLVNHTPFRSLPAEKLMEKVLIDACGTTYQSKVSK